jgi:hypothetical protein
LDFISQSKLSTEGTFASHIPYLPGQPEPDAMPIHPDPLSEHHEKNKDMQEVVSKKGEGKPNQKRRRGKQQKKKKRDDA